MSQNGISDPGTALPSQSSPPPLPAAGRAALELWVAGVIALAIALGGIYTYWSASHSYVAQFGPLSGLAAAGAASTPPVLDPRAAWGQYGDFMGGAVNPALGLLTLLALVATVWLQMRQVAMGREQLELSRNELELTRRELERSANAQHEAAEAMKGQLHQARLTAQAQTAAAEQLLATARHTRQAGRIQALNTVVEKLIGVRNNDADLRAEFAQAFSPEPGQPSSDLKLDLKRQQAIQELIRLLLKEGDIE